MDYSKYEERVIYQKGVHRLEDVDIGTGRYRFHFTYPSAAVAEAQLFMAKLTPTWQIFWNAWRIGPDKDKYPGEGNWAYFEIPDHHILHIFHRERMLEPRVEGKDIVIEVDMLEQASPALGVVAVICVVVVVVVMLTKVTELVVKSGVPDLLKGGAGLLDSIKKMIDKAPALMIPLVVIGGLLLLMLLLPKSIGAARSAFKKSES
jgi:hypothetical protein